MTHPATQSEILSALESNAQSIVQFFSSLPGPQFFDGDSDHWSPAHHVVHLTQASVSVERAMRSGSLPLHTTARSRTYAEVRDAATASLGATPKDRLLEMGRTVVVTPGADRANIVDGFAQVSERLRTTAAAWTEEALDRHALTHPLMGEMTAREMLLFFVVHERHHLKIVRGRVDQRSRGAL